VASSRSYTFLVFTDLMSAASFANSVRANTDNQTRTGVRNMTLEVAEVAATT